MGQTSLAIQARKNEIERQLASNRFRLRALEWVASPTFLALLGYLVYFAIDRDVGLSTKVLGGAVGLVIALITAVRGYRDLQAETRELEEERLLLTAGGEE